MSLRPEHHRILGDIGQDFARHRDSFREFAVIVQSIAETAKVKSLEPVAINPGGVFFDFLGRQFVIHHRYYGQRSPSRLIFAEIHKGGSEAAIATLYMDRMGNIGDQESKLTVSATDTDDAGALFFWLLDQLQMSY